MKPALDNPPPLAALGDSYPPAGMKISWCIFVFSLTVGALLIYHYAVHTPTYTIDSYFYLSKAKQLLAGEGLTTAWNDGADPKYFPGYSLLVAAALALHGSFVHVQLISYIVAAVMLMAVLWELRMGYAEQILAATAFSVNPIIIKWFSLPMAEGAALALCLAAVLMLLRFTRTSGYPLLYSACLVGGFTVITRAESLFLLFIFALLLYRKREAVRMRAVFGGLVLFLLPLGLYVIHLRFAMGGEPAYVREFGQALGGFNVLKNLAYNVWVPFGLMHKFSFDAVSAAPIAVLMAGAVWVLFGGVIFLGGLVYSLKGRLGPATRAATLLFLLYAGLHSLWYYRYERFMLPAIPLAAIVWAQTVGHIGGTVQGVMRRKLLVPVTQILLVAAGLALCHYYTSAHVRALQRDTEFLQFQEIAAVVNELNDSSGKAVLTDLGPHLAYYLDAQSYMDGGHGNYWQSAFAAEQTAEALDRLDIGMVVTKRQLDRWLAEHDITPEQAPDFSEHGGAAPGVSVIRYNPASVNGS